MKAKLMAFTQLQINSSQYRQDYRMKLINLKQQNNSAHPKNFRQLLKKITGTVSLFCSMFLLFSACSDGNSTASEMEEQEETTDQTNGLFLSLGNDANGLYLVDPSAGKAVRVGAGETPVGNSGGLA
ncbi:MAG: hypothetical protein RI573_14985, partial [Balneolaceae bacterium]|nr:hypothetical protein [Balneolaceae bacterium]